MRKDVFISFSVHITLVILILFFSPTSSNTKGYPTIYNVGLVSMPKGMGKGGGSKAPSEVSAEMKRIEEGVGLKQIMKDGRIKDAKIETSSGFELFDQAALRAVLSTNPLPPLPREYTGESLGVHLEFEYSP